eukprot:TRINITY_DN66159_c0_g1_i1.p2 TRINITY_DN66159_c0_g1~~TRINITY_DN66159_c0_g1_i1.p2  ORF type:complete len:371 (+),score=36.52 TRINITY_DN66159_c0_g1_i1:34-1113(+)
MNTSSEDGEPPWSKLLTQHLADQMKVQREQVALLREIAQHKDETKLLREMVDYQAKTVDRLNHLVNVGSHPQAQSPHTHVVPTHVLERQQTSSSLQASRLCVAHSGGAHKHTDAEVLGMESLVLSRAMEPSEHDDRKEAEIRKFNRQASNLSGTSKHTLQTLATNPQAVPPSAYASVHVPDIPSSDPPPLSSWFTQIAPTSPGVSAPGPTVLGDFSRGCSVAEKDPIDVFCRFNIFCISELNMKTQSIKVDFYFEAAWEDRDGVAEADDIDWDSIWQPDIVFMNRKGELKINSWNAVDEGYRKKFEKCMLSWRAKISGEFHQSMDFHKTLRRTFWWSAQTHRCGGAWNGVACTLKSYGA